jgi:UDP-glucuronate decarboxylase
MSNPKLSIIIPAYKEERNIFRTIDTITSVHDKLNYDYELLVVVDGSPDRTAAEARRHPSTKVKVFEYKPNQGKGHAIKYGVRRAIGEVITFTDAGGDFAPEQFDKYLKYLELFDADIVIGSKRHPASKVNYPFLRRVYSRIYYLMIRALFGLRVTDTQAGIKFFKKEYAQNVLPRLLVKQYAFDLEMLVVGRQLGYTRIFEAPVELHFNKSTSGIDFSSIKKIVIDTLAVFYRAKILRYYTRRKLQEKTILPKTNLQLSTCNSQTHLVAGGAGFIGSHLTEHLLNMGQKVIVVDNLITGNLDNIKSLRHNANFRFIKHDICQPITFKFKIDFVENLACPASPVDYRKLPLATLKVSSLGTKNMLELAKRNKARFFHTSTSEVYGDPKEHPQKETYWGNAHSYGERSCYDEGKRYAEALIYYFRHDHGVDTGIIRIFNTYGPKMRPYDGRVVTNFIRQALAGENITIYGQGDQTRSFCYIDDQIDAQIKMIYSNEEGPINIGNPDEFTILELARKIIELTNSRSKIVFSALPKDDPTQRCPDISLAKEKLDWAPKIDLDKGLKRTISWLKNNKL